MSDEIKVVVDHLIQRQSIQWIIAKTEIPRSRVEEIAGMCGYPSVEAMKVFAARGYRDPRAMIEVIDALIANAEHLRATRIADRARRLKESFTAAVQALCDELEASREDLDKRRQIAELKEKIAVLSAGLSKRSAGLPPAEIRKWAVEKGIEVPGRGRLPQSVIDAYNAAHPVAK